MEGDWTDDPDLLWLAAECAPSRFDRAQALLRFALKWPDDTRWQERLRYELRADPGHVDQGCFLNCLTQFPGHGICALPEVLALTGHPDGFVRGWVVEDLVFLAHDHPESVDPTQWVEVIWPRLADERPFVREEVLAVLRMALARDPSVVDPRRLATAMAPLLEDDSDVIRRCAAEVMKAAISHRGSRKAAARRRRRE